MPHGLEGGASHPVLITGIDQDNVKIIGGVSRPVYWTGVTSAVLDQLATLLEDPLDDLYLRLDASNDPVTGDLLIKPIINSITVFQVQQSDATVVINVDTTNARVGIVTASPATRLHVRGPGDAVPSLDADTYFVVGGIDQAGADVEMSIISGTSGRSVLNFGNSADENIGFIEYEHINDDLIFGVGTFERMRIDNTGNVGINSTSPTTRLEIITDDDVTDAIKRFSIKCNRHFALMARDEKCTTINITV